MGLLEKINELKAKKINDMTLAEVRGLLHSKPLDDIQLSAIQKRLELDTTALDGFDFKPAEIKGMSRKQHELRIVAGLWHVGDIVYDKENCMNYSPAGSNGGLVGRVVDSELAKTPDKQIVIPERILGKPISSLESAFFQAKHLTVPPIINCVNATVGAKTFCMSGITKFPNIDTVFGYPATQTQKQKVDDLYRGFIECKNISYQEMFNFVLREFSGQPKRATEWLAQRVATDVFGLSLKIPFIRKHDAEQIQSQLSILEPNATREEKLKLLAQIACNVDGRILRFATKIEEELCKQLRTSKEGGLVMYINEKPNDTITMSKARVPSEGIRNRDVYLLQTDDKICVIYDPEKEDFYIAGHVNENNNLVLMEAFDSLEFHPMSDGEKENVLNEMHMKFTALAREVLDNENAQAVPVEERNEQQNNNIYRDNEER